MAKRNRRKVTHIPREQNVLKRNKPQTPIFLNGLSYPRPGSHWKNIFRSAEVVVLPSKGHGFAYFYVVGESKPMKMALDEFYKYHSLIRQTLPDEDYMSAIPLDPPEVIEVAKKKRTRAKQVLATALALTSEVNK